MHANVVSRRRFLALSGALVTAAACGRDEPRSGPPPTRRRVQPTDPLVAQVEQRRAGPDARLVRAALTAGPMTVDLAGRRVETWGYGGVLPGPLLRATAGDRLEVEIGNELPEPTSIHWHGLALRNDMDGVNDLTQPPIAPGSGFTYRFALAHPGTYWFHPHVGLQLDRGLYAPLVIDDPAEPGRYDAEHIVVLDDWLDGFGTTPDEVHRQLTSGMAGMDHGGTMGHAMTGPSPARGRTVAAGPHDHAPAGPAGPAAPGPVGAAMGRFSSPALGGDAGDVAHAAHLINGRPPADRPTFEVPPGGRVRLRLINAGSDTAYRVAVGGHRLTITHTDGFPVEPTDVDALLIGMGERYDVTVTTAPGAWPIVAEAEGKAAAAVAVLRTAGSTAAPPPLEARPAELGGQLLDVGRLRAAEAVRLGGDPEVTTEIDLTGDMASYRWAMHGGEPVEVHHGQRVRLVVRNRTTMWHPVHVHGHTFALPGGGARKDTVTVLPDRAVAIDLVADNPGQWMVHCHNAYHLAAGMGTSLAYVD